MMTLFILILVLGSGFVALLHYAHLGDIDWPEASALSGGIGLAILSLASLFVLLPRAGVIALVAALMLATPVYLYDFYRRRFAEMREADAQRADAAKSESERAAAATDTGSEPTPPDHPDMALGPGPSNPRVLAFFLLFLLAAFLRFANLGYSEFQGDEARAVLMAHELGRSGDAEVLLRHKKGPIEILLPAAGIRQGQLDEAPARLPFAIAGFLGVVMAAALGARLFGTRAGWLAALLLALDGYLVAFSRIVQYQSIVFFFSVLAVWCAWRFHQRARDGGRYLFLAGVFLGLGSWAHYEMIFALPPVAWLVLDRGWRERWRPAQWLRQLALPVLAMAGICLVFYLPFVRHEQFAATWSYIAGRRVGGGMPYNMLGDWFQRASFYNASYYVIFIAAAMVAVTAHKLSAAMGRPGRILAGLWLAALALLIARPAWFVIGPAEAEPPRSLAILVFLPVWLALFAAGLRGAGERSSSPSGSGDENSRDGRLSQGESEHSGTSPSASEPSAAYPLVDLRSRSGRPALDVRWCMLLLWLAGPFFAAAFLVKKPHTHFYTMLPAWMLMAGWGLDRAVAWLERRMGAARGLRLAGALGLILVLVFARHQQAVFVDHDPEYKRVWPEARLAGYWTPFGDSLPRGGYFGFPYRAGWSTVRDLYRSGRLSGSYDSNEESLITGWYTMGAPRCADQPDYYLVAWRPQDDEDIPEDRIAAEYRRTYVITVGGQPKLEVFARNSGTEVEQDSKSGQGAPVGRSVGTELIIEDDGSLPRRLLDGSEDEVADMASDYHKPPSERALWRADRSIPVAAALELPLVEDRRDWQFGDAIRLVGLDYPLQSEAYGAPTGGPGGDAESIPVQQPGWPDAGLGVTLVWQALAPIDSDYSVFLHLLNEAGETVAQSDGWPACGGAPTSAWGRDEAGAFMAESNEFVYDPHRLKMSITAAEDSDFAGSATVSELGIVASELPEGRYQLRAGLYDARTGERLPARPAGEPNAEPRDAIELWSFEIRDAD